MKAKYQTTCIVLSPDSLSHSQVLIEYLSGTDFSEKLDEATGCIDYDSIQKPKKTENPVIYGSFEINDLFDLNTFKTNILEGFPNTTSIKLLVLFEYRELLKIQKKNEYRFFLQSLKTLFDECYPSLFRVCIFACAKVPFKIETEIQESIWKNNVLSAILSIWNNYKVFSISDHIINIRPDDKGKSRKDITRLLDEVQGIPIASLFPEEVLKPFNLVNRLVSSQNIGVLSLLAVFLIWCTTLDYTEEWTYIKLGFLLAVVAFAYTFYNEVSGYWSKSSNHIKKWCDSNQKILSRFFLKTDQHVDMIFSSMEKTIFLMHEVLNLIGDNLESHNEAELQLKKTLQTAEKQIQKLSFLSGKCIVSSQKNFLQCSNNFNQILTQAQHELKESGKVSRSCIQNIQKDVRSFDTHLGNFFSETANATGIVATGVADAARAGRLFNKAVSTRVKADMKADFRFCNIL